MRESELQEVVKGAVQEAVLEGLPEEDGDVLTPADVEKDEISAADALIDEIRGEAETTVNIYRLGTGRGKEAFLYSASPEDITAKDINERCRDQHGGGDFKMVTRDANRIVKSARFSVEAVARPEVEKKPDGLDIAGVLAIMQASNDRMMNMFQITMSSMAEAMKGGNQPAIDPNAVTKTIMDSVVAMKGLTDAPKDTSGTEMVSMLVKGVELASKLNAKDGETNSYDLLGKALDFLPSLADAAKKAPVSPPGPSPDPDTQASIEREHRMAFEKQAWQMNVGMLVVQAKQGKDPTLYAELICDQMGDEKVLAFINHPDALERLIAINPEVATVRGWFEALKVEILELTKPEEDLTEPASAADTVVEGEFQPATESDVQSDGADSRDADKPAGRNGGGTRNT